MNHRLWIALMLAGSWTSSAHAADPTKAEIAVARQYFDAATAAENQGRWRDAIDNLNKAIAIKETAGLRYHLGFAKENLGMLVDAMLEYQRASGLIHSGMTTEEVERFIVPKLEEMRKRVPTLTVTLPPDAKGAQLRIDGALVKPELLGAPIPLNPGTHALVVFAPGRRPFHVQVTVSEGSAVTQAVELVPEVGGSTPTPADAPVAPSVAPTSSEPAPDRGAAESPGSARTWVVAAEGAVAVAGLGVGIGFLAAAGSAQQRYDDANAQISAARVTFSCANTQDADLQASCAALSSALDDRNRDRNIAIAGFIAAGAGAVAAVTTLIVWKTPERGRAGVFVAPQVGQMGMGLAVWGAY